ncbi:MAG: hypothetical protein CM15mP125_2990 [Gammaproteobacteria bacterium]|nr:MAG: hypothetical protein CM15mP125_2990 [Gammaproteobacteria bacterium]
MCENYNGRLRGVIKEFHDRGSGALVQIALAPCSPFSVSEDLMESTSKLAKKLDVRLHTHLAETQDEETFVCRGLDCGLWNILKSGLATQRHLDRTWRSLQSGRNRSAWFCQTRNHSLSNIKYATGVRYLPGSRTGACWCSNGYWRRRLRIKRLRQHDS